jgi:hypothetical protein
MRERASTVTSTASWPPINPDENDADLAQRREQEDEAKKISDAIDAKLGEEKERLHERNRAIGARVLLLGQAES